MRRKGPLLRRLMMNPWLMCRLSSSIQRPFGLCVPSMSFSIFVVTHPAELLAVRVLQSRVVRMSTFAELIPLLPAEVPARAQDLDSRIHTFTTGAYVRGGIHGPRCNLTNFSCDQHAVGHPAAVCVP